MLVTLERDGSDLSDRYFELKEGLQALFDREVDVVIEESIRNPYFKQGVERNRKTSMQLEVKKYLFDILEATKDIEHYTSELGYQDYLSHGMVRAATERKFEIYRRSVEQDRFNWMTPY